jgi:hypothetical protein
MKRNMKKLGYIMKRLLLKISAGVSILIFAFSACDYLDVVPEGTATLDNAFNSRVVARRYLSTCYSYLTTHENGAAVDITGGDEVWWDLEIMMPSISLNGARYAQGLQTAVSPLFNYWSSLYMALRDCNIFIENVGRVPDLPEWERDQWMAEAKVLKAYYHFLLLRQYGPVPIVRESLPIDTPTDEVRVKRDPADEVANYAVELIDQATPYLDYEVASLSEERGRITKPIALTIKALIRVTIASPLFNPTSDVPKLFASLHNPDDTTPLISQTYSPEKWALAVAACKEALDACDELGLKLYEFPGNPQLPNMTPVIKQQLSLRNAFCEKWNGEKIWGETKAAPIEIQALWTPKLDPLWQDQAWLRQYGGPPLKIAEQFYSKNGVPIDEDKTFDYANRYDLQTATAADALLVRGGSVTAKVHFNREPRFYAWLGFDNGVWYGQSRNDDADPSSLFYVQAKSGQFHSRASLTGSTTGYYVKKWIYWLSHQSGAQSYSVEVYIWPYFRLAELYLLYAEALNEAEDSETNRILAMDYLNRVRERAGLPTVQDAWDNFSTRPNKYKSQAGLRDIIRQERLIELCFERKRFWDIRRWMTIGDLYQIPIQSWNTSEKAAADYYRPITLFEQKFNIRDYFWPIPSEEVTANPNLVQNIGW